MNSQDYLGSLIASSEFQAQRYYYETFVREFSRAEVKGTRRMQHERQKKHKLSPVFLKLFVTKLSKSSDVFFFSASTNYLINKQCVKLSRLRRKKVAKLLHLALVFFLD